MFFFRFKSIFIIGTFILNSLIFCSEAYAVCQFSVGTTTVFNIPSTSLIVQRDAVVGEVIFDSSYIPDNSQVTGCDNEPDVRTSLRGSDTGLMLDSTNIFSTNISGIGYAITYMNNGSPTPWPYSGVITGGRDWSTGTTRLRLVVTGSGNSGSIDSGVFGRWTLGNVVWHTIEMSDIYISRTTCSFKTPVLQVTLDDVMTSELTSVGATAKPKTFDLGLNCNVGARINVVMAGGENTDAGADGVLKLTNAGNAGVAEGLGIQILYDNVPVKLNAAPVLLKIAGDAQELLHFTAQYYQTLPSISPGQANATMTLEITYQ